MPAVTIQMFLRNQPQQTKCFIEKRRLGVDDGKDEVVAMIPIQLNEMILQDSLATSGQRVSIICNSDHTDVSARFFRIRLLSLLSYSTMNIIIFQNPRRIDPDFDTITKSHDVPGTNAAQSIPHPDRCCSILSASSAST